MEGNFKEWINRINAKQDVLTEDNVGEFMDVKLSTKSTPTSGDTVLGRDSVTGKAVKIPTDQLGGNVDLTTKLDKGTYTGTAQDLKNDIDNLQIGGRNLLLNTSSDWTLFSGTGYGVKVFTKVVAKVGETFTAKVFVRNSNSPTPIKLEMHELNSDSQRVNSYSKQVVGGVVEKTITTVSTNIAFLEVNLFFGAHYATNTYQYEYSKPKLERGNKATDWTPAPEDKQDNLQNIS